MGFGISFGGGSSKTKSSSVNQIDKELKPLRTNVLGQAMGLANQPIQQFQGQRVAGFTPYQQQAFGQVGALGQQGQGLAQRGFDILGGIGSAADRISAYQNPFTNEVIDRSMSDLERQRQINGTADAAKAAGAPVTIKGFVRFAVGEGVEKRQDDFAAEVASMTGQA